MAENIENVETEIVFRRDEDGDANDIWDDTALIKAYDHAIGAVKLQIDESPQNAKQAKAKRKRKRKAAKKTNDSVISKWKVGAKCCAVFSEDGRIYNAMIRSIDQAAQTCIVHYTDYGNEEEQKLMQLLPANTPAVKTTSKTPSMASDACSDMDHGMEWQSGANHRNEHSFQIPRMPMPPLFNPSAFPGVPSASAMHMPPMPPPPMTDLDSDIGDDKEALYGMLMSWYMSGYHTGYYQGKKNNRKNTHRPSER